MTGTITIERKGDVLVVVNDNPANRNALNPDFYVGFAETLAEASSDPTTGAIVLTGAGDFFCSGGDLNRLKSNAQRTPEERRAGIDRLHAMIAAMRDCPKPIIAAVEGGAAGAGVSLALACDMIVAASEAYFSVAYVRVALSPDGGVTAFLGKALPRQLVTELCLTGKPVSVERLHQFGVVNHITDKGGALEEATTIAQRLTQGPARTMARIKSLCHVAQENSLQEQLDAEADLMVLSQGDAEAAEGIGAFLEKRKPDFPGLRRAETKDLRRAEPER